MPIPSYHCPKEGLRIALFVLPATHQKNSEGIIQFTKQRKTNNYPHSKVVID